MLRRLRRAHAVLAPFAIAIAAMVVLGSADWWHANDNDDDGIVVFHDHNAHRPLVRSERDVTRTPEHCYLCHWLRSLNSGLQLASSDVVAPTGVRHLAAPVAADKARLASTHLPARAPPA